MILHVLDTSAIMCVLFQEPGAREVLGLLEADATSSEDAWPGVLVPFMAWMEMEYWLLRRHSAAEMGQAMRFVEGWPAEVRESTPQWRHQAARVKAATSLSLADAWIASLAILEDGQLVHNDPEFDQVSELRAVRLPNKVRGNDRPGT